MDVLEDEIESILYIGREVSGNFIIVPIFNRLWLIGFTASLQNSTVEGE
jgi:hypothetical protein